MPDLPFGLSRFFRRKQAPPVERPAPRRPETARSLEGPAPVIVQIDQRMRQAVENILGNESLTADLDDTPAQAVLDWAVSCARSVVRSASPVAQAGDIPGNEVEDSLALRLKAVHQMTRTISSGVANRQNMDEPGRASWLERIFEQAQIVYGERLALPDAARRAEFLKSMAEPSDATQLVQRLRQMLEGQDDPKG